MEPYSMPQLDNSDTQYEGDDISNPRASSSNVKKQYTGGVTGEPLPLLSSSAWSAVIHRPAEEDSEPDDLPSTVDMDAIKGSPATPLAATAKRTPSECWSSEGERKAELRGGNGGDGSDSDGSDEDSDSSDDSASSASDSGSESGSCTWSDSDSASTSCSSRSRGSSQSSRVHQTFSIRETNFDQGGLKLKFSALKTPKKVTSKEVASQPVEIEIEAKDDAGKVKIDKVDDECDLQLPPAKHDKLPVCADLKVETIKDKEEAVNVDEVQKEVPITSKVEKILSPARGLKGVRKQVPSDLKGGKEQGSTSPSKAVKTSNQVSNGVKVDKTQVPTSSSKVDKTQNQMPAPQKPVKRQSAADNKTNPVPSAAKAEESLPAKKPKSGEGAQAASSVAAKATVRGVGRPVKGLPTAVPRVGSKAETRSDTRKADTRRKELPTTRSRDKVSGASGGRAIPAMRVSGNPPPPYATTGSPRGGGSQAAVPSSHTAGGDGVAQLAQQLATAEQETISVSEHLQVINQEDLAAILPDVVAPDDHHDGPFDGFEDVGSESGKGAARGGADSSSDVELPEQVVSAAIERIHLDGGGGDSSSEGGGGSCDEEAATAMGQPYASSLLQQFVEKTELLSSQVFDKTNGAPKRRKRGRPPKASKSKRAPEIEAYMRLDCSVSNVSPDSGIQSVAGSPIRRSVSPPANQIHSPESPPPVYSAECKPGSLEVRRRPGRPKGSGKKAKDFASGTDSCDETPAPRGPGVVKRGPGRPKKTPSVLEPVAPVVDKYFDKLAETDSARRSAKRDSGDVKTNPKKKSCDILKIVEKSLDVSKTDESLSAMKQPKSSAILSEICERVSKRLDLPIHSVTSYPLKLSKVKLAKDFPHDDKLKKLKKKKEVGEGSEKEASDKRSRRFSSSSPGSSNRGSGSGARNQVNNSAKPVPAPRLPPPRLLSLPPGIPHKHKKKKKKSKPLKMVRLPEDPTLLSDLERLVHMFRRSCTITMAKSSLHRSEASLPSIFRVKRIGKKRKGSDKSRNTQANSHSDRESGPEGDGKEKSRQRRPKKSAVEPPKGHHERSEPATNEQRLPLKKRHYHMSLPQAPSTSQEVPAVDKAPSSDKLSANKLSPADGPRKSISGDRSVDKTGDKASSKPDKYSTNTKNCQIEVKAKPIAESSRNSRNSITSERGGEKNSDKSVTKPDQKLASKSTPVDTKAKPNPEVPRKVSAVENARKTVTSEKSNEKISDKILLKLDKGGCNRNSQVEGKAKPISDVPRNSIDEAIEACITRYTTTARPTVITTPKKRHRLENSVSTSPRLPPPSVSKTKDVDISANNNNKTTVPNSPLPSKRSTSRSSSANAATTNSPPPPPPPTLETRPMDGIFEPSPRTAELDLPPTLPNTMSRTVLSNKPISPNAKVNTLNILNSLAASSAAIAASNSSSTVPANSNSKSTPPNNKSAPPTHKSATNSTTSKAGSKLSALSAEHNSVKSSVAPNNKLISCKTKPTSSQSPIKTNSSKLSSASKATTEVVPEVTSESTVSHNLRLKRPIAATPEESIVKRIPHKRKKLSCDVRVRVRKPSPTEETPLVKTPTDVKPKIKRRKAINRTGFPVKKKKKKKVAPEAVQVFEDCEDLIPKSIIRQNAVINNKSVISTCETARESDSQPKSPSAKKGGRRVDESTVLGETEGEAPGERTRKRKREGGGASEAAKALFPLLLGRFRGNRKEDGDTDSVDDDLESTKSGPRKRRPRWRKKFLPAGLFSDYYKEDAPRVAGAGSRLAYRPEEHRHGLLPPPYHCGKYLRQRRVEFKLPYDMWWQHTHNQLPGRDLVPSWNYKKIRTNVYYDVKPTYSYEAQACNCTPVRTQGKKGCGEDCINRMVYSECSSQLCPCRECCCNQRIQRHEWAPGLEKFMTKDKGWGVKTKQVIKSGEFILEYVGEVVSEKEFKDRMASRYMSDTHHYCLNLDGGLVIDGHRMGGDGRFVNHSCEPNCEMQKWSVNGLFRMALFALRDIRPGEELSYDYNFSLFNPAEGQPCKCGSDHCRGVIGGKSQRVNNGPALTSDGKTERRIVGRPRKNARKNTVSIRQGLAKKRGVGGEVNGKTPVKPMSHQQRCFAQIHHCFLLRNLEKVKRLRERLKEACLREQPCTSTTTNCPRPPVKQSDVFMAQLNALSSPRNIRTRRLAQAEDNPELTKTAHLAYVFRDLYNTVIAAKDEQAEMLAAPFLTLPTKRKLPAYFQRVTDPIDLGTLEHNIVTGLYRTVEAFDADMTRLFTNNVRFFGRTSDLGIVATRLRKVYNIAKLNCLPQLEEILGESPPQSFIPELNPADEEEDVIRCVCGLYRDEGTMIQCERCLVWQHCDCVHADQGVERYLCERCDGRKVDLEVKLEATPSYATPGHEYYVTLLRGDLQLRQGDTVYVLRDMDVEGTPASQPPVKVTYKTVKAIKYTDLDIFRIERLWKDEKGDRFAFGHHFLRPHETFHEPSRKFFPNEVMRVPLYEVVPVELIMGQCWVLDVSTFYKGRPFNAPEEHVYVCEYRVDKTAHLFTKIARPRYPICTKSYAFEMFDTKVKPVRTYTPHGQMQLPASRSRAVRTPAPRDPPPEEVAAAPTEEEEEHIPLARRANQKVRLNSILLRLLARLPSKQPLDVSYLLEPGRRHRKKTSLLNT